MFNENNCLENLKHIVSEHADDENIKNLSLDELRSSYTQLADNLYSISVSNHLKYKNMLWNINKLKPEIRSKFQTDLFNIWHSIYITSIKTDPAEDLPESKKHDPLPIKAAEERAEIGEKEQPTGLTRQESIDSEKQKTVASVEGDDLIQEETLPKKQSHITASGAKVHQFENDWFDKLLDFFAAIVGGVSKLIGH